MSPTARNAVGLLTFYIEFAILYVELFLRSSYTIAHFGPLSDKKEREKIMSIRKLVAEKIEIFRKQIAVWDSPSASPEAKGKVVVDLLGNDPRFLNAVGKLATTKTVVVRATEEKPVVASVPTIPAFKTPLPPVKFASSVPTKPVPATAPARTLESMQVETPEQKRDKFFSILTGFLAGKRIDFEKTRGFMASVFRSGVSLARENWETIFAAMKKAAINSFYLLDSANAPKFFAVAPADLTDDYVFGQDGAMVLILADISELEGGNKMPNWLVAKVWILMAALITIESQLDDFGIGRVQALLTAVEGVDGPENLIGEIRSLLPTAEGDDSDSRPLATATIGEILKAKETARAFASQLQ